MPWVQTKLYTITNIHIYVFPLVILNLQFFHNQENISYNFKNII